MSQNKSYGDAEKNISPEENKNFVSNSEEEKKTHVNESDNQLDFQSNILSNDSSIDVITEQPNSISGNDSKPNYEDVYRAGNFGKVLGKINIGIARKWAIAHMICMSVILILTIIGHALLDKFYTPSFVKDFAIAFTWLTSSLGISSASLTMYFFWRLQRISRPYALLMTVRFLAIFTSISASIGIIATGLVLLSSNNPKNQHVWVGTSSQIEATKIIYGILLIFMILELIVSCSFVLTPTCSEVLNMCSCCGPCCMHVEGEEIAPGVANPPSHENWMKAAQNLRIFNKVIGNVDDQLS